MSTNKPHPGLASARQRIVALRSSVGAFDIVCSGNLQHRRLSCGNPICRCKRDPAARHGPYFYWGRRKGGRLVQKLLTPAQAKTVQRAIRNHKAILRILRRWEDQTVQIIDIQRRLQD